ncbi:MAG: hypothetical protein RML32_10475, partial [Gammaproteobacteria bacterium]|nr:hypothetical protein [Gammaproteobacteria bacterium]
MRHALGRWPGIAALLLSACGFHLQGRATLPAVLARPYIVSEDPHSAFAQALRRSLVVSGAQLASDRTAASAVITLERDALIERVLAVSSRNIPREYELTYQIRFGVAAGDRTLIESTELAL